MFKILKSYIILIAIILNSSIFAINVNFSNPTTTPSDLGAPNLSDSGQNAFNSQIATDSSGRYVYAVWQRSNGSNIIIQVTISSDFGVTWADPTSTPSDLGAPNLSDSGEDAFNSQIATDSSGRYVYAVWQRSTFGTEIIQVAISSDFGVTWTDPTSTPSGTSPPNLSDPGKNAEASQIATDSSGRYVYAVWDRVDSSGKLIIQVAISSDFGVTWTDPTTTPTGTSPPNLSDPGQNAFASQIATDSSGRYVYAVWQRSNAANDIIQVAISSDFGVTWADPTSTPSDLDSPNLSDSGEDANLAQIATDSSGRYVYAIWQRSVTSIIQVAISSDFGVTWTDPTSTPSGTSPPNLSASGEAASRSQIATDSTGRYVYAVWQRSNGAIDIIQVAISSDFGVTWTDPTTTPTGTSPNLSVSGNSATISQIATDSSGRYVYAVWVRSNGTNNIIQVAISSDFGVTWTDPTTTPTGTTPPNLSVSGANANRPQIATDSTGRYGYAVWDRVDTNNIIQVTNGFKTFFPLNSLTIKRG